MIQEIDMQLVEEVVKHYNTHESTVRETAEACGTSKSTVYFYLTKVMPNPTSEAILERNKQERHIRGGMATREKYRKEKAQR